MQTLTIRADENALNEIKALIKDKSLKVKFDYPTKSLDEIRAEVRNTIEQIKKGTMKLYTQDEYNQEMDNFFKRLEV